MAKKKKKSGGAKKKSGGKVQGAKNSEALQMIIGGLFGFMGISYLNTKVTFLQGKIGGILELVVGAAMVWKMSHPAAKGFGMGLAMAGGNGTAKTFGLLAGIGATRRFSYQQRLPNGMSGFRDMAQIGKPFPKPSAVGRPASLANVYAGVYGQ